jgi:membrane dipeptidase
MPPTSPSASGSDTSRSARTNDGATIPAELGDVSGTPRLLEALGQAGFGDDDLAAIAWGNWRRVLDAWWR